MRSGREACWIAGGDEDVDFLHGMVEAHVPINSVLTFSSTILCFGMHGIISTFAHFLFLFSLSPNS